MLEPGRFTSSRFGGRANGGGSEPLPRLNATISPDPIVAGEQFAITFEEEPETVTAALDGVLLTVSGSGLVRTATALETGTVTVDARKDGFRRFYASRTVVAAAPTPAAPNVTAAASISATGTVLDGPLDTVTGYPAPEPAFQWFDGQDAIPGATGKSYDHGGADGVYSRQTTWTNGVGEPAVSTSNTITIAPAPGIEVVSLTPNPMVAGQSFTIVFNTDLASNEVTSSVTLSGTGDTRTGTAPADDTVNVSISATKSGWRPFSEAFDVAPPPPTMVLDGPTNTLQFPGITAASEPFPLVLAGADLPANYVGTFTVTPADMADGPDNVITPTQTGTGTVGEDVTLDPGLWVNLESAGNAILSWTLFAGATEITGINGDTYTVQAGDAGKSLTWHVTCEDANGERTIITNAIAVPASGGTAWWDPRVDTYPGSMEIDLANGRARINGQTYASIAAAKTAGAIKTSGSGVDYVDVSGLGTSIAIAATGVTPPTVGSYSMIAMDDGDDGVPADEYIQIGVTTGPRAHFASIRGGSNLFVPGSTVATPVNTALRVAMRAKAGGTLNSYRGSVNGAMVAQGQNAATELPAVTRFNIGNRAANDRAWVAAGGTLSRLILINADLTDGAIDALLGA